MKKIAILCFFLVFLFSCEKKEYCLNCHIRVYDIGEIGATEINPIYAIDTIMCGFDTDSYSYIEKISPRLIYEIRCKE